MLTVWSSASSTPLFVLNHGFMQSVTDISWFIYDSSYHYDELSSDYLTAITHPHDSKSPLCLCLMVTSVDGTAMGLQFEEKDLKGTV